MLKPGDKLPPLTGKSINGSYIRLTSEHLPPGGAVIVVSTSESKLKPFERLQDEFYRLKSSILAIVPGRPPARSRLRSLGKLTIIYDPGLEYLTMIGLARRSFLKISRVRDAVIIVDDSLRVKAIFMGSKFEILALRALEVLRENLGSG
ncbi:hypothetical protein apy_16010 [Aeropyrum pernix]|uniref:Uncharacterized protein n=1 Tax=Aeropyrum pernix TaxID=56636 RepID=A0A401HBP8_AERPX|nr:hypothetical protein [Aeropyrum pernix]GBF09876.1 hypothetical protein apy_16010 [Aeropyrum pernix]